jgi:hypothetical protein
MHELPDRMHRAPLDDVQRAVVTVVCDALDHSSSMSLLSDISVAVSTNLERICDIAREELVPAISRVTRLLSSTSADLTHAFKGMARLLSVNIDKKVSIQDPASILLELLPSCDSLELVAAALSVLHAIQVRMMDSCFHNQLLTFRRGAQLLTHHPVTIVYQLSATAAFWTSPARRSSHYAGEASFVIV